VARVTDRRLFALLAGVSLAFLAVRLYAASRIGFADSEALYACYALHPQPAYLDHPGLIGLVARAIGGGLPLTPASAHHVTAVLATLVPWALVAAARLAGASWRGALLGGLGLVAAPEISFGLFAMTPDLPLAFAWLGALGLAAAGLRAEASSGPAAGALLFAGMLAGVASVAKVSGALLVVALIATYLSAPARAHARTVWPWAGLAAGALIVFPVAVYEARTGFPLLRHRLVDTQSGAGLSLRNLGAVLGGQCLYVSPVLLVTAALIARDLFRSRADDDAVIRLFCAAFALPLAALVLLSLWSRVAEPHWLAPALLALPLYAACASPPPRLPPRLMSWALATGLGFAAVAHAWVLVPAAVRLVPESTDPALDIANELFGWPAAINAVRDIVDQARIADPNNVPAVVGPVYTVCAQLHAGLERDIPVGCDDPVRSDFDDWLPRADWERADEIIFVSDNRFPVDLAARFPHRFAARTWTVPIARDKRTVRTFRVALLLPRALGDASHSADEGAIARSPASRMSERSACSSGFGVVRSFSP
jgi:hypothetical protein